MTRKKKGTKQPEDVREPVAAYSGSQAKRPFVPPLFGGSFHDSRRRIKAGFPPERLDELAALLGITLAEAAEVLDIPPRTLARRRAAGDPFTPAESDRIQRLAEVWSAALDLFESDAEAARLWLKTPLFVLGNETPLAFSDTGPGARFIIDLAGRLAHGVFS
jgi:putative toxin-antitoxin system antitoxin component (TIGR02293 family)